MNDVDKIKAIKAKLPFGGQKAIAKKIGVSTQTVNYFFQGTRNLKDDKALKILELAKELIEKKEIADKAKQDLINSLSN